VAAAVTGPRGEPPGRGVLKPETIAKMREAFPAGLGYEASVTNLVRGESVPNPDHVVRRMLHFGANPGWNAHFLIDTGRRKGFVVANNSSLGLPFNIAVQKLWFASILGVETHSDPPNAYVNPEDEPEPGDGITARVNTAAWKIALALWLILLLSAGWCIRRITRGQRSWQWPPTRRRLVILSPAALLLLVWLYVFHAPQSLPLPLGPALPSVWNLPLIHYTTALLLVWLGVTLLFIFFPRKPRAVDSSTVP